MKPVRISAVSYYNTLPFIYGIMHSGLLGKYELELDVPAVCAEKLLRGEADLSLVPVGALPAFPYYQIVGNHCIGAVGNVKTVLLLSNIPVHQLTTIYLDPDSRTSVNLVRILARRHWRIQVIWKNLSGIDPLTLAPDEGVVLIGDKTFGACSKFRHSYDLAGCWNALTGLPFVFAAWVTTSPLPVEFVKQFEAALSWGVDHSRESIQLAKDQMVSETELICYLEKDISFQLDESKRTGLDLFLSFLKEDESQ